LEQDGPELTPRAARFGLTAMVALYVAWFFGLCVLKWRALGYDDFDLAIFDQAVWNTAHLNGFFETSIRSGSLFTDHVPLILLGAVPLYWMFEWIVPGALILLFLQTAALGGGAVPLFLLARDEIGRAPALAVAAAYLLYPALGYMNLFEFHPGVLAVFFLLWTLRFLHAARFLPFVIAAVLAMACREDVALAVMLIAPYALLRARGTSANLRSWDALRWAVVPGVAGALWFGLAVGVVIPAAAPDSAPGAETSPFVNLYGYLTESPDTRADAGAVVAAVVTAPVRSLRRAAALPHKELGRYNRHLFTPLGGLPLLGPQALVPALPNYALNLLAYKAQPSTICYQYTANLVPFLFLAVVLALRSLGRVPWLRGRLWIPCAYLLVCSLGSSWAWGKQMHPLSDPLGEEAVRDGQIESASHGYSNPVSRDAYDDARASIVRLFDTAGELDGPSADARVVASLGLLHRLADRRELRSWHYVRTCADPVTGEPVVTPLADVALLDFRDRATFANFGDGASVMLRRGGPSTDLSDLVVVRESSDRVEPQPVSLTPQIGLLLLQATIDAVDRPSPPRAPGTVLQVQCTFAVEKELLDGLELDTNGWRISPELWAHFTVRGAEGTVYARQWPMTYTLYPLNDWRPIDPAAPKAPHAEITVTYPLLIPEPLVPGRYDVFMSLSDVWDPAGSAITEAALGSVELR